MMFSNKNTFQLLKNLCSQDEWGYLFENIEKECENVPDELIDSLAKILAYELEINSGETDKINKIKYFITLGYFSHE